MKRCLAFLLSLFLVISAISQTSVALAEQLFQSDPFQGDPFQSDPFQGSPLNPVFDPFPVEENPTTTESYTVLMREYRLLSENKALDGSSLTEEELQEKQADLKIRLEDFLAFEQENLATASVSEERKQNYFSHITDMIDALSLGKTEIIYSPSGASEVSSLSALFDSFLVDAPLLNTPSSFDFSQEEIQVESLELGNVNTLIQASGNIVSLSQELPVLADVQEDGNEIIINEEISALAEELGKNPVRITNFVKENIVYEPYYGAKKGALGCLRERVCNDTDAASLAIALLRASGIPARYRKSPVLMSIDQLKKLLAVEEARTVYATLYWNLIPVFVLDASAQGIHLDTYDFSGETHFVVEWVHPEMYFEYDQLAGNRSNDLDFSSATNTAEVETILRESSQFSKKQWIGIEPVLQEYIRDPKEIVHDTASFDTQTFWTDFLSYQGDLSPLEKYIDDLKTQTGKDITEEQYQSTLSTVGRVQDILPPTLPYFPVSTSTIATEQWSVLPNSKRHRVDISLRKQSDNTELLSTTFYGNEINNVPVDLGYEGATEADKDTIASYEGIYATPAHLVAIVPKLHSEGIQEVGTTPISIGDRLILKYEYSLDSQNLYEAEKFSIAGNSEGIFITLSKVAPDPTLDDESDPDRNSRILLEGNAALAREYLRRAQESGDLLKKTFDFNFQLGFAQATVTQNRILAPSNGVPTAFDFKGLTIDAAIVFGGMYSHRGNYKNHFTDMTLLLGEQFSYDEAQFFEDIAGLEAISTVQGLQYAYANPQDYAVYTITSSNASVIDSLSLSQNTKQNMHADVQAGRTIITPNKPITKDGFTGVLYISLSPDGTGNYSIGEQVSNGGWTVSFLKNGEKVGSYFYEDLYNGEYVFVYGDSISEKDEGMKCFLTKSEFDNFSVENPDYGYEYGLPCIPKTTKMFGDVDHTYALATHGAWFKSNAKGYEYWKERREIRDMIDVYITDNSGTLTPELIKIGNNFSMYDNFRFSPKLGTYIEGACEDQQSTYCPNNDESVLYYSPNTSGGNIFRVKGKVLTKLEEDDQKAIQELGIPTDHEQYATDSGFGSGGTYQNFMEGQVYMMTTKENEILSENKQKAYYVPSEIDNYYNNNGGSGGKFGFPESDPYSYESGLAQNFEGTRIDNTAGHALHSPVLYKTDGNHHFLIIDLNSSLERRACFKHYINLEDGVRIGDTDSNGNIKKNFILSTFKSILTSAVSSVVDNRKLNGFEPTAVINGDYYEDNQDDSNFGLRDVNFSLGHDYSGDRRWTSVAISSENDVIFTTDDPENIANQYKSNIIGGGPKLMTNGVPRTNGEEGEETCEEIMGKGSKWIPLIDNPCDFHAQRTVLGITEENYMVLLVTGGWFGYKGLDFYKIDDVMNQYKNVFGNLKEVNMFDSGGSSSLMFEGEIKQKNKPLMSLLMVYEGEACTQ
ncbi:phosphodiester glycosidase family protein [Candidatus Peregrinibacteria bacterium]|nr:MAG: phosphodiester glycosidase family protein [Candidatus Peregrinibacteria bacterium]